MSGPDLVVIGGSWGGLDAACALLHELPAPLPVPVLLVLHRARTSDAAVLREAVHRCSGQDLVEVSDQQQPAPGAVHLAPPDYHVLVEAGDTDGTDDAQPRFSLSMDAPVEYARPSINVAFESAARALGPRLCAVLLSGAGRDGADGVAEVGRRGGLVLVQTPGTATRAEMPAAGLSAWPADVVGSPHDLGRRLGTVLTGSSPGHAAPARPRDDERRP